MPTAVWIDEDGCVVRGPESAGASEAWRDELDRETGKLSDEGREALAAAHFRLGQFLRAPEHLEEAVRLAPESWNYRRQAWALDPPEDASGRFWAAVDVLPPGAYYPSPQFD